MEPGVNPPGTPLTSEEIIEKGGYASAILGNETLMEFFRDELERIKTAMCNTLPDEGKHRSNLYYQHYGVTEFLRSLAAYKDAAEETLAQLEAEQYEQKEVD